MELTVIKQMLGHGSLSTTAIYLHVATGRVGELPVRWISRGRAEARAMAD